MSAVEIRTEIDNLVEKVHEQDESFLKVVYSMLSTYVQEHKDPILGYETDGTPVTASAFLAQADETMAAVERGEYITLEQLEKESEECLKPTK